MLFTLVFQTISKLWAQLLASGGSISMAVGAVLGLCQCSYILWLWRYSRKLQRLLAKERGKSLERCSKCCRLPTCTPCAVCSEGGCLRGCCGVVVEPSSERLQARLSCPLLSVTAHYCTLLPVTVCY